MALNENILQQLQRYLDQDLNAEEAKAFEAELQSNEALAKELALHQEMQALLSDTPENALRKNLQDLSNNFQETPSSKSNPLRYLLLLLPLLLLAIWWVFMPAEINQTNPEIPTDLPIEEAKEGREVPISPFNDKPQLPSEVKEPEQKQEKQQIDTPKETQDNTPPPIALISHQILH